MYIFDDIMKKHMQLKNQLHSSYTPSLQKRYQLLQEIISFINNGTWCTYKGDSRNPKDRVMFVIRKANTVGIQGGIKACASHYNLKEDTVRVLISRMSKKFIL